MEGGYILLDVKALDFTSASKQTGVILHPRVEACYKSNKPVLVYGLKDHTPTYVSIKKSVVSTKNVYEFSYVDGLVITTIKFEDSGTTITSKEVAEKEGE